VVPVRKRRIQKNEKRSSFELRKEKLRGRKRPSERSSWRAQTYREPQPPRFLFSSKGEKITVYLKTIKKDRSKTGEGKSFSPGEKKTWLGPTLLERAMQTKGKERTNNLEKKNPTWGLRGENAL